MRIQHNIPALNSYRNYSNNVKQVSKNLEKLSTGYKINRAGDDAAGLAISEKMRIQVTGLEKAQDNAKAGINLVQTAEGALTEVHDMLNRMYSLAEQSANGTYDNSVDRKQLQKEVDSLRTEIDRIADSTNYNGINLLDGTMERQTTAMAMTDLGQSLDDKRDGDPGKDAQAGVFSVDLSNTTLSATRSAITDGTFSLFGITLKLDKLEAGASIGGEALAKQVASKWNEDEEGKVAAASASTGSFKGANIRATVEGSTVVFTMDQAPAADWTKDASSSFKKFKTNQGQEVNVTTEVEPVSTNHPRTYAQANLTLDANLVADGRTLTIGKETYVFAVGSNSGYKDMANVVDLSDMDGSEEEDFLAKAAMRLSSVAANNEMFKVGSSVKSAVLNFTERDGAIDYADYDLQGTSADEADGKWTGLIKSGTANLSKSGQGLTLQIGDTADEFNQMNVSVKDMHSAAMGIGRIDISIQGRAQEAMDAIKAATNYVSDVRGGLGALQNRLDHTINNLSVAQENITDAESTIRDTDVAKEMMAYTKNNILVQSAQAMLAQANQLPQGVLQLLG